MRHVAIFAMEGSKEFKWTTQAYGKLYHLSHAWIHLLKLRDLEPNDSRVESRLQKSLRDIGTIWSWGLKLNWSNIKVLCELEKVYLGMEKVIRSCDLSHG